MYSSVAAVAVLISILLSSSSRIADIATSGFVDSFT